MASVPVWGLLDQGMFAGLLFISPSLGIPTLPWQDLHVASHFYKYYLSSHAATASDLDHHAVDHPGQSGPGLGSTVRVRLFREWSLAYLEVVAKSLERGGCTKWFRTVPVSLCLPVCLSACLSVCLSACLPVCLSACLSVCLPACMSVCLAGCLSVGLSLPLSRVCHLPV